MGTMTRRQSPPDLVRGRSRFQAWRMQRKPGGRIPQPLWTMAIRQRQLGEKRTEPNSAPGGAIGYTLKHWEELTLFLRQAGAPLDNNVCERALKKAIPHRKNALFYETRNGARVGDLFMSLIY